jgi:hypothetical protein
MPTIQPPSINNAYGIICDAMIDAGKLRRGDEPGSEDLAEYMRRLNKLVNYFMTQGCKLWLIVNQAITLLPPISSTQGVALYTLGPAGTVVMQKPLRVISGYYLDIYNDQRPLISMSYPDEYTRLSNVLQPGSINSYAVDKQQNTLNVYFWMAPDAFTAANGTAHLMLEQSVTQFTGITDSMNFPIEWSLPLEWGLANQISVGQPALVQAKCAANAQKYQTELEDWDVEDADTMFQPDQRQSQYQGRFR